MSGFIGYGDIGIWVTNGEVEGFLDWFADHRCQQGDARWQACKSAKWRWPGCGLDLETGELIPRGQSLGVTKAELAEAAAQYWKHFPRMLSLIDQVTRGEWQHQVGSQEAIYWRVPWIDSPGFTVPGAWSREFFSLHLDFPRPDAAAMVRAARAVWSHTTLQGCWLRPDREPTERDRVGTEALEGDENYPFGPPEFQGPPSLYGLARIRENTIVPCKNHFGLGSDYMYSEISLNATALGVIPHTPAERAGPCGLPLFQWLAEIAASVNAQVPVRAGIIGWEPTAPEPAEIRTRQFRHGGLYGYLLPRENGLEFVPPSTFTPP